jgi:hypothetical protein
MGSRALITAGVAAGLLVIVVAADASMTATYTLDVWTGTGWRELAREPLNYEERAIPWSPAIVSANGTDELRFRVQLDNTYPWARSTEYRAYNGAEEVAAGDLRAEGRSHAEVEFTIPASRFFDGGGRGPAQPAEGGLYYTDVVVRAGGESLYGSFALREVGS